MIIPIRDGDAKPCPFCGSARLSVRYEEGDDLPAGEPIINGRRFAVWCRACDALGPACVDNSGSALVLWNSRLAPPAGRLSANDCRGMAGAAPCSRPAGHAGQCR